MSELLETKTLNLDELDQVVWFDVQGYSVGVIQVVQKDGSWGSAVVEIVRGNVTTHPVSLLSPVTLNSEGMTPTIDLSAAYLGAKTNVPAGGLSTARVIVRAFNA